MFSRIGNFLYHSSSVNKNSISYINKQNENITLDPSGTDYVEYSTDSDYFTEAHSLIPNSETQVTTTALKLQDSSTPANNFFFSSLAVSSLGDFTLCVKHKLNAPSTSTDIISHYFTSPQYDITLSVPYVSETIPFNVIVSKASDGPLDYEVSGNLTIADLTNGDISGTLSTVESVLPYTLNAGTSGKDFVFLLNDLDISLNTPIYTQYTVMVTDLDTTSPAFSLNGVKKQSITFTGGVSYVFDQSDSTNAGYPIVFGTTADDTSTLYTTGVTEVGTPGQAGAYTKIEYSGSTELFYFSSEATYMGYGTFADVTDQLSYHTNATNNNISGSSFTNLVNSSLNGTIYGTVYYQTNIGGRPCYLIPKKSNIETAISLPASLPTNSCTFSAYFYRTSATIDSWTRLVGFNYTSETNQFHSVQIGDNSVTKTIEKIVVYSASGTPNMYTGNPIPGYDEWIHFCMTYYHNGSSSSGNIYINGVKETTYSNSTLYIEQYILGGHGIVSSLTEIAGFYLNDVRVYNKELKDSEVSTLYDYISQ